MIAVSNRQQLSVVSNYIRDKHYVGVIQLIKGVSNYELYELYATDKHSFTLHLCS